MLLVQGLLVHHEAHEATKKGKFKGDFTTEDTEDTEKVQGKVYK